MDSAALSNLSFYFILIMRKNQNNFINNKNNTNSTSSTNAFSLPNSFKFISSCIKTVSSSVRASVADDDLNKDQVVVYFYSSFSSVIIYLDVILVLCFEELELGCLIRSASTKHKDPVDMHICYA